MVPAVMAENSKFLAVDFDFNTRTVFSTEFYLESVMAKGVNEPLSDGSFAWSKWLYQAEGLSYDWTAHLLYVTDYKLGTFLVVQPFLKQARAIRKDLKNPRSIVVHPGKGLVKRS